MLRRSQIGMKEVAAMSVWFDRSDVSIVNQVLGNMPTRQDFACSQVSADVRHAH